jgi:hypothetical protein
LRRGRAQRGSALIVTMSVMAVVMLAVASLMLVVQHTRINAINQARSMPRNYCVDTGLQLARLYFGNNFSSWNTYLSDPAHYDPVVSSWNPAATAANPTSAALQAAHPELFADLDGDGQPDVYIYVRDNADELPPATENWMRDNDMQVYVGAVCISSTLVPRLPNGKPDTSLLSAEALLVYNAINAQYAQRCQAQGNCNIN